jgi:hypothetical protein
MHYIDKDFNLLLILMLKIYIKYIKLKLISYHETLSKQGGDVIEPLYR